MDINDNMPAFRRELVDEMIGIFQGQARVWDGTQGANEVLEDTARAIGEALFQMTGDELNAFAARCMARFD